MTEVILNFLYTIFDFFLNLLPSVPVITNPTGHTALYTAFSAIGLFTGYNAFVATLLNLTMVLVFISLLASVIKFIIKAIPFT